MTKIEDIRKAVQAYDDLRLFVSRLNGSLLVLFVVLLFWLLISWPAEY